MRLSSVKMNPLRDSKKIKQGQLYQITVTHYDPPTRVVIPQTLENTYQLEPHVVFPQKMVEAVLKEMVDEFLQDVTYDPESCRDTSKLLADSIKERMKSLQIQRYKIITLVTISAKNDCNFNTLSACIWEPDFDKCATYEFSNNSIFASASVFAIYQP